MSNFPFFISSYFMRKRVCLFSPDSPRNMRDMKSGRPYILIFLTLTQTSTPVSIKVRVNVLHFQSIRRDAVHESVRPGSHLRQIS